MIRYVSHPSGIQIPLILYLYSNPQESLISFFPQFALHNSVRLPQRDASQVYMKMVDNSFLGSSDEVSIVSVS
jgi:hypothetical protein